MRPTSLVTGAAGFIGSHLVENLLDQGHEVTGIDNLSTGRISNLAPVLNSPRFRLLRADVTEDIDLPRERLDYVWHLASPASPVDYRRLSIETLNVNSVGTHKMLELARACGVRFLLASTSEVYGEPEVHPQPETYWGKVNPNGERSCYDEGKRFAEALTMEFHRRHRLDVRIVRIFNTYGPRMRRSDGRVIPSFISQALAGRALTIFGTGEQTRSFLYVDDLVAGLNSAMYCPGIAGEVFNIGGPDECTIVDLAGIVSDLCHVTRRFVYRQAPPDDPSRRRPDTSKARSVLGWQPRVSLRTGLERTIAQYGLASTLPGEADPERLSEPAPRLSPLPLEAPRFEPQ